MPNILDILNVTISPEAIERMEGLTDINAFNRMEEASATIYTDLSNEGFERQEIIAYLMLIVEAADRYAENQ